MATKIGQDLAFLYTDYQSRGGGQPANYVLSASQPNASLLQMSGDSVGVELVANVGDAGPLSNEVAGLGAQLTGAFGNQVSAMVPIADLSALTGLPDLNFARAGYKPVASAGEVDDQAVQSLKADVGGAQYGVDGTGVTVGILSDESFNNKNGRPPCQSTSPPATCRRRGSQRPGGLAAERRRRG